MTDYQEILGIGKPGLKINRILIIYWGHYGEVLLTTPLLECLRKAFPNSYVTYIVGGNGHTIFKHGSTILYHNPNINKYIKSDQSVLRKILMEKPYDLTIDLCAGKVSFLITRMSKARIRIWSRFKERPSYFFYNYSYNGKCSKSIKAPFRKNAFRVERFLSIARLFDIDVRTASLPRVYLSKDEKKFCLDYLSKIKTNKKDIVVAMHPGGRNPTRLWNYKNYALLADKLAEVLKAKVIVFYGPGEKRFADRVAKYANNKLVTVFRKDIRKYIAIISGCNVFVSTDGGPLHIALALGVASVGLFIDEGSMNYWYGQYKQHGLLSSVFMEKGATSLDEVDAVFRKINFLLRSEVQVKHV